MLSVVVVFNFDPFCQVASLHNLHCGYGCMSFPARALSAYYSETRHCCKQPPSSVVIVCKVTCIKQPPSLYGPQKLLVPWQLL